MDAQTVIGLVGVGAVFIPIGIAVGRQMTVRRDITDLDQRVHKLSNRLQVIPERPDDVYARKDTMAIELGHIRESLARIEAFHRNAGV